MWQPTLFEPETRCIDVRKKTLKNSLKFIDLFAGIGGTRLAFENTGAQCVFSSEWDKYAATTYCENFGETPAGDIRATPANVIPPHNVLVAGFPCQPFSISGVSKKVALGRPHGFQDLTQGTLFFEVVRILRHHKPDAFLLENVKNLRSHDHGRTLKIILGTLVEELGYDVHFKVLDASAYVPQHRERIYIVGFREKREFLFPVFQPVLKPKLRDILEKNAQLKKYHLTDHLWQYLQNYAEKHRLQGNGFGFGMAPLAGHTRTLSARYYKDGSEILVPTRQKNPRRLTPRECARLMGFPESFRIVVSDTQAYKQFGNSVVVPIVHDIARAMVGSLSGVDLFGNEERGSYSWAPSDVLPLTTKMELA
jgi:DNA (cytosine-5)-methyltransferase 1